MLGLPVALWTAIVGAATALIGLATKLVGGSPDNTAALDAERKMDQAAAQPHDDATTKGKLDDGTF
jgi:hypothetical protein